MQNLIKYCANLLGIDIANPYSLADIGEIEDLETFVKFAKNNIKSTRLDFLNPLQKLNELKKMYTEELNRDREQKAQTQSQKLEEKFRKVKPQLKAEHYKGLYPKLEEIKADNSNYFTKFEIEQLNAIGQPKYLVMLSDTFKLQEAIEKTYLKVIYKKPQIAVTNNRDISKALEVKRI